MVLEGYRDHFGTYFSRAINSYIVPKFENLTEKIVGHLIPILESKSQNFIKKIQKKFLMLIMDCSKFIFNLR